jgi:hypothetical protein
MGVGRGGGQKQLCWGGARGLTEDKEDLVMLMLGVDTIPKLAAVKQTTHLLLTSLFVRARFSFLPSSGARRVPPLRNVHTGSGKLRAFYPRGIECCFSEGKSPGT